jgi:hypothetical protein
MSRRKGGAAIQTVQSVQPAKSLTESSTPAETHAESPAEMPAESPDEMHAESPAESRLMFLARKTSDLSKGAFNSSVAVMKATADATSYVADKATLTMIGVLLAPIRAIILAALAMAPSYLSNSRTTVTMKFIGDVECAKLIGSLYTLASDSASKGKFVSITKWGPVAKDWISFLLKLDGVTPLTKTDTPDEKRKHDLWAIYTGLKKSQEDALTRLLEQSKQNMPGYREQQEQFEKLINTVFIPVFLKIYQRIQENVRNNTSTPTVVLSDFNEAIFTGVLILEGLIGLLPVAFIQKFPVTILKLAGLEMLDLYVEDIKLIKPYPISISTDNTIRKQLSQLVHDAADLCANLYSGLLRHDSDLDAMVLTSMRHMLYKIKILLEFQAEHPTTDDVLVAILELLHYVDTTEAEKPLTMLEKMGMGGTRRKRRKRMTRKQNRFIRPRKTRRFIRPRKT